MLATYKVYMFKIVITLQPVFSSTLLRMLDFALILLIHLVCGVIGVTFGLITYAMGQSFIKVVPYEPCIQGSKVHDLKGKSRPKLTLSEKEGNKFFLQNDTKIMKIGKK